MAQSKKYLDGWSILALCAAGLLAAYAIFRYIKNRIMDQGIQEGAKETKSQTSNDTADTIAIRNAITVFTDECAGMGADSNFAILLVGQSIHETSAKGTDKLYHPFTSNVCISNNNYFGMMQPHQRNTTSIGEKNNYASYESMAASVQDRLLYAIAKEMPITGIGTDYKSVKAWVTSLKEKGYFTASTVDYCAGTWAGVQKVKTILQGG
jgi:hypothetical protein